VTIDTERFRARLTALRDAIRRDRAAGDDAARTVELDQSRVGRLSRMDALQAQAMSHASGRRRDRQLRQIDAALDRIDRQEFGYCTECGEAISAGRLDIEPTTTHCIECASRIQT
jgi:DnaK suppressor protein